MIGNVYVGNGDRDTLFLFLAYFTKCFLLYDSFHPDAFVNLRNMCFWHFNLLCVADLRTGSLREIEA